MDIVFPVDLLLWALAIIVFLFGTTYVIKRVFGAQTYYFVSLLKTKRFLAFIERISKPGVWDLLADIGLILGFGAIATDYLFGRNKSTPKRILIALISIAVLFFLFFVVFGSLFVVGNSTLAPLLTLFSASFAFGGLMLFVLVSLVWQAWDIVAKIMMGKVPCPGIAPVIPGVQMPNLPSFLTPPLSVWGAFLIILVVHEFSHGALMKRAKITIKSTGLLLAGLLPIGAFVEPDEKQIKTKPERQQLRVYAIGPASNLFSILVFVVLISLASAAISPVLGPAIESMEKDTLIESVVISKVLDDYEICGNSFESPAMGVIEEGWILREHNGVELKTVFALKEAFNMPDKNVSMVFETEAGETFEKSLEKNIRGQIGIEIEINYVEGREPKQDYINLLAAISGVSTFLWWLIFLSFALAIVNFLPVDPFDGGKISKIVFLSYFGFLGMSKEDTQKFIGRLFLWIVLALIIVNAIPLFM